MGGAQALPRVDLDELPHDVASAFRDDFTLEPVGTLHDDLVQVVHGGRSEGHCADEHDVEAHACRPHVTLEATITTACDDLWRNVRWRAALLLHLVRCGPKLLRDTKVADLDLP